MGFPLDVVVVFCGALLSILPVIGFAVVVCDGPFLLLSLSLSLSSLLLLLRGVVLSAAGVVFSSLFPLAAHLDRP